MNRYRMIHNVELDINDTWKEPCYLYCMIFILFILKFSPSIIDNALVTGMWPSSLRKERPLSSRIRSPVLPLLAWAVGMHRKGRLGCFI